MHAPRPPNRVGSRLRELYAYLFGAELPEPTTKNATQTQQFGSLTDLGFDPDDQTSMPWWRRGRKGGEKAFDTPVVEQTDVIAPAEPVQNDIDLLETAGHPFMMNNANPDLIARLPSVPRIGNNFEAGVAHHLRKLFALGDEAVS